MERKQTLPEYLKQLRKSHHYKQEEIASVLHISRQTYSHYETGRIRPSINTLYGIARLYGILADDILEHVDTPYAGQESGNETDYSAKDDSYSEKEMIACLHRLNEKNRKETLSVMREIMQAKILMQEAEPGGNR